MMVSQPIILITTNTPISVNEVIPVLEQDYHLLFCNRGREVLEIALNTLTDLILIEDKLPDTNCLEVCSQLGGNPRTCTIPVVCVFNKEPKENIEILQAGAVDYITYPIHPSILKTRVRNWIDLKRYRDQIESKESIDRQTGIPNRSLLDKQLKMEWNRGIRTQAPQSLIIIDIDFYDAFKNYYGHLVGADCLRKISQTLVNNAKRKIDYAVVNGEDEFIVLLPETDESGALKVAKRFQAALEELDIPNACSPVADHVTASIGMATIVPTANRDPALLLQHAQTLLREAKKNGYNQIQYEMISRV